MYSGACTIYHRSLMLEPCRFGWDPSRTEEHQSLFEALSASGWKHYLLQAPELADHRMKRLPSTRDLAQQLFGGKS
jgi:hypothetical protein